MRQNRRKSQLRKLQNRFWGVFSVFATQNVAFSIANHRFVHGRLPYLGPLLRFASSQIVLILAANATFSRQNATVSRRDATVLRQDATLLRRDATFLRHSVKRRKSDLRQIAFRFLTVRIRVGGID